MQSTQPKPLPPGNLGLSSLGDTLDFIRDNSEFAAKHHAQHPQVKEKAKQEQAQFRAAKLSLEVLQQMTYLDSVLKEVLRLIAPVGGGFRKVLKTCEIGDYTLPQGWSVLYSVNLTHQDSRAFPSPAQFDPERFCDRAEVPKRPYSYLPFGGGVRECLGKEFARLEMKLFAAKLLQQYDWELLPNQNLQVALIPTPRPKDGLKVHVWKLK